MGYSKSNDRASPEQLEGWRRMTPAERLQLADRHRAMGLRLLEAGIRHREPELDDAEVRQRLWEIICRG